MSYAFDDYRDRFPHVAMERRDGVLELRLHTDGGPLVWGSDPHTELGDCFAAVARDRGNRLVILTGTGDKFIADLDTSWVGKMTAEKWDEIYFDGKRLLTNLLAIEVPVIGAVNGPATVHAELAVLSDLVLASDTAVFADAPHFRFGTVPSDGVHAVWPALLGPNRGRAFLLTGQRLSAAEALQLGVVHEVVPATELRDRTWEWAAKLARQPDVTLRYTRVACTQRLKRMILDEVGYGLALEGLAAHATWPTGE